MDQAEKTMIDNLYRNTGKTLDQWIVLVKEKDFTKHADILKFLKDKHGFTHGFANLVALKSRGADTASVVNKDELIDKQYIGKEHLRPMFERLLAEILKFGNDIEVAPPNAYVSLKRMKQFAILQPATKTHFEIGLNLKGQEPEGALEAITSANAMRSHKINLSSEKDISSDTIMWLKKLVNRIFIFGCFPLLIHLFDRDEQKSFLFGFRTFIQ